MNYIEYGEFQEYVNKGFWRDLINFLFVIGCLFVAGLIIQMMFVGMVVFFTRSMKPVDRPLYVPQKMHNEVGGLVSGLCPQSCSTSYALQPAVSSQYLNGVR